MAETDGRLTGRAWVCRDSGPGRDQPAAGYGRCHDEQFAGGGVVGPGWREVDLQGVPSERRPGVDVLPVTKWVDAVLTPGAVPEMIRKAFKLAQTERPGAVYLAVPEDVEAASAPGLARSTSMFPGPTCRRQCRSAGPRRCDGPPPRRLAGDERWGGAADALRRFSGQLGAGGDHLSRQRGVPRSRS